MISSKGILLILLTVNPFILLCQISTDKPTPIEVKSVTFEIPSTWKNGTYKRFAPVWSSFLEKLEKTDLKEIESIIYDSIFYFDSVISKDQFITFHYKKTFSPTSIAELNDTSKTRFQALEVSERIFPKDIKLRKAKKARYYKVASMRVFGNGYSDRNYRYFDFIETNEGYKIYKIGFGIDYAIEEF